MSAVMPPINEMAKDSFVVSGDATAVSEDCEPCVADRHDVSTKHLIRHTMTSQTAEEASAFYVCNVDDIVAKYVNWMKKMPGIHPFFALKCNDTAIMVEVLVALGVSFDCASQSEIETVLRTGVPPSHIIFANPCKSLSSLAYARSVGVDLMTFDSEDELVKIASAFPEARLVMRIKADDSHATYRLSMKFGAPMCTIRRLILVAQNLSLNLVGVSFHVGGGGRSVAPFRSAIADARTVFDVATAAGFSMNLLDIGGGYPGGTDESDAALFDKIAATVREAVRQHFPAHEKSGIRIIAEPGRYFATSAFSLTSQVLGKRIDLVPGVVGGYIVNYFMNDGMYGSFNAITSAGQDFQPRPEIEAHVAAQRATRLSTVWGPTCDSLDVVRDRCLLMEMERGEWLTFGNMGAYGMCLGTRFNGLTKRFLKVHVSLATVLALKAKHKANLVRLLSLLGVRKNTPLKDGSLVWQIWRKVHHLK